MPSKLTGMLASGRPIVATAVSGTQVHQIARLAGVVVPPGDVAAFAAAIERLAENPLQREALGRVARDYAVAHLDRDVILGRLEKDLRALVGGG
jgi:colanic acid biosynthesis glycosyl transferase WcaI